MTHTCPSCGQAGSGRFCSSCGASLEAPQSCTECGNQLPVGGRFCNQCGAPTPNTRAALSQAEAVRPGGGNLPWIISGVALVALIAVLLWPRLRREEAPPVAQAPFAGEAPAGGPMGDARSVDIASMSPRERADRLFNRVMQNVAGGDSAQAQAFLPMAIAAYQQVPDLDADARYHMAVLHLVGNDARSARAQADTILRADPNHLFGLFTAAQAEKGLGNAEAARRFYRTFLDRYDAEIARGLQEYTEHQPVLAPMRQEATTEAGG